jgi:hypothetical protein
MQCALVIPTLQPGTLITNCITSAISGGYDGDIYVVSNDIKCNYVITLGSSIRFVNTNTSIAESTDMSIFKGFKAFDKSYDLMIYSHNDVIYHNLWWERLKEVWGTVNTNKVWSITVPATYEKIVFKPGQKLAFSFDIYNPLYRNRFSPCTSFLYSFYSSYADKYGGNTYFSGELLMYYEAILQHKWGLVANNGCFVDHFGNGDVGLSKRFGEYFAMTYKVWKDRFGYNLEHFIASWFGNVLINHTTEILDAVNNNNYDKIDYIFDDGLKAIANRDCKLCGNHGCRAYGHPSK